MTDATGEQVVREAETEQVKSPVRRDPFVDHVAGLDAGAKAALRRSLAFAPGTWPGAFPYVEPWVTNARPWERRVAYMVAGLQALSRSETAQGNLGEAARRLELATQSGSVEARFLALLDADPEQLPHRLRQMITLMSSHGIAPDWGRLRRDLNWWRTGERLVQQRWARGFYRGPGQEGESDGEGGGGTEPTPEARDG